MVVRENVTPKPWQGKAIAHIYDLLDDLEEDAVWVTETTEAGGQGRTVFVATCPATMAEWASQYLSPKTLRDLARSQSGSPEARPAPKRKERAKKRRQSRVSEDVNAEEEQERREDTREESNEERGGADLGGARQTVGSNNKRAIQKRKERMLVEASKILYNEEEDNARADQAFRKDNSEFFSIIGRQAGRAGVANIGFRRSSSLIQKVNAVGNWEAGRGWIEALKEWRNGKKTVPMTPVDLPQSMAIVLSGQREAITTSQQQCLLEQLCTAMDHLQTLQTKGAVNDIRYRAASVHVYRLYLAAQRAEQGHGNETPSQVHTLI